MAVNRGLAELAGDLRVGDGTTEPTGPVRVILERIAATARVMVVEYVPSRSRRNSHGNVREALWVALGC